MSTKLSKNNKKADVYRLYVPPTSHTYGAGTTGGETSHKLTTAELPSHNHPLGSGVQFVGSGSPTTWNIDARTGDKNYKAYGTTASTGSGASHNNMPPYLSVYMWRRTA